MAWTDEQSGSSEVYHYVYTTRSELLTAAQGGSIPVGAIGIVNDEPGNIYIMGSTNMWIVRSGNGYPTANLPTTDDFIIPIYTQIIDRTTGDVHYEDGL